jgi:hypothetical protein
MIPRFLGRHELTPAHQRAIFAALVSVLLALAACSSAPNPPSSAAPQDASVPPNATPLAETLVPSPTPPQYPWTDENAVMSGLCFESVYDAAGRTFVILDDRDLQRLFDLADSSQLCRHPVQRGSFDFSGERFLMGLWSRAVGCTARHDVTSVTRDDVARTYIINLRLVVEPGCDYELVRPFWIGLSDLTGYDVRLLVEQPAA